MPHKRFFRLSWLALLLCLSTVAAAEEETEIHSASTYTSNVTSYGMVPIYGRDIADGTYPVDTRTNSAYFKLHDTTLTVDGDSMTVTFYIDSTSYTKVYLGTAKAARDSQDEDIILCEVKDDVSWFTIPIISLNSAIDCAAYSKRRKKWYGRQLLFLASSLPEDALAIDVPDYDLIDEALDAYETGDSSGSSTGVKTSIGTSSDTETGELSVEEPETVNEGDVWTDTSAVLVGGEDGDFSIEVVMTGGSGRASVSSPTYLTVHEGRAYATLLWSSTYYDYVILEGKKYLNEATDGGISRFTIPITAMDEPMEIIADTTAMGDPVEITYTLTFYEETIGDVGLVPQEATKKVLIMALVIIVVGGVLNWVLKRRRR